MARRDHGHGVPSALLMTTTREHLPVDEVWRQYKAEGSREDRDRLIVHYRSLVEHVARRLAMTLGGSVDQEDLVAYGIFGLIDAIDKFDVGRGLQFASYAAVRIRGSIIDELRATDWVPRSVRAKGRAVENAQARLQAELHRAPTGAELADEMAVSEAELAQLTKQLSDVGVAALDNVVSASNGDRDDALTLGETLADRRPDPAAGLDLEQLKQTLAAAINGLDERQKAVVVLHYIEELSLSAIGEVFGVSESRICQVHTGAVQVLMASTGVGELVGRNKQRAKPR
jgi:RNA polymerase sigma factor FliA